MQKNRNTLFFVHSPRYSSTLKKVLNVLGLVSEPFHLALRNALWLVSELAIELTTQTGTLLKVNGTTFMTRLECEVCARTRGCPICVPWGESLHGWAPTDVPRAHPEFSACGKEPVTLPHVCSHPILWRFKEVSVLVVKCGCGLLRKVRQSPCISMALLPLLQWPWQQPLHFCGCTDFFCIDIIFLVSSVSACVLHTWALSLGILGANNYKT